MAEILMDNSAIRVVGGWSADGKDDLMPVVQIAFNHHNKCVSWAVREGALYLFWTRTDGDTPLLTPVDVSGAHRIAVEWLAVQPYPDECGGGDVDEEPAAFEAWTDMWGHGGGDHRAILAIKPRTRWLGK